MRKTYIDNAFGIRGRMGRGIIAPETDRETNTD
jgi:hypothetical protein